MGLGVGVYVGVGVGVGTRVGLAVGVSVGVRVGVGVGVRVRVGTGDRIGMSDVAAGAIFGAGVGVGATDVGVGRGVADGLGVDGGTATANGELGVPCRSVVVAGATGSDVRGLPEPGAWPQAVSMSEIASTNSAMNLT